MTVPDKSALPAGHTASSNEALTDDVLHDEPSGQESSLNDDVAVASEIVEDDIRPGTGPIFRTETPPHVDTIRARLAFWVVIPVFVLYALVVAAGLFGFITSDDALPFVAALSGPQALAAAVVGFYYGKRD